MRCCAQRGIHMLHAPHQSLRGAPRTFLSSVACSTARWVGLSAVRYASAQLPFPRFPGEAHYAQRPAEALCTEALPLLGALSVRIPFGRPAVPSDGRVLSFSRAAVTPIGLSTSAPHRHIGLAPWLVYSFLRSFWILNRDPGEFPRGFGVLCSFGWWRFREGARSVGPGLGARLHLGPPAGVTHVKFAFGGFPRARFPGALGF